MKAIIFDTEEAAKDWDWQNNQLTGSITRYKYSRKKLKATTTLTKAEYAELMNIPRQLVIDEEGTLDDNPAYTALDDSYTLHKYALIVGDDLTTYDEEGNATEHPDVVTVAEDEFYANEEIL